MRNLKLLFFQLLCLALITSVSLAQQADEDAPESIFVPLKKHKGWGPFSPRKSFKAEYSTGSFKINGQKYTIYQLLDPVNPRAEQRFIIRKSDSEVSFTEKEGSPVYNRHEEINLQGMTFDIFGYSEKANQFVLFRKEDVKYAKRGLSPKTKAPKFSEKTLNNDHLSLDQFRGKYVLMDFWGTWCGPCLHEIPFLKGAYQKYGEKIQFIGVAVDYDKQRVIKFIENKQIRWPQIFISKNTTKPSPLIQQYNVIGYPAMYLIDPTGNVLIGPEGETRLRGKRLSETLKKVLNEK